MATSTHQPLAGRLARECRGVALTISAAALVLAAAACTSNASSANTASSTRIIAMGAENEYANVLSQVGGRYVQVSSILSNPNTDPHTFEASPQVAQEVSAARLIVQNGLGYDSWMNKIESASPSQDRKVIDVQHVLGLPGSSPNPHLWYNPATMPAVARAIAADLSALQPAHAAYFRARLKAFDRSLTPWLNAIARFKTTYPGATGANTEPVADFLLTAMGITNLTPFRFHADRLHVPVLDAGRDAGHPEGDRRQGLDPEAVMADQARSETRKAILDVGQVSVSLSGRRILDEVSFTVGAGQFTGLIGPNGAGKT